MVQHLRYLQYLDISFHKIDKFENVHLLKSLKILNTVILTKNDFILTPDVLTTPGSNLHLHCDCDLFSLRNYTWDARGRCTSPPKVKGYDHVSCFSIKVCPRSEPLYVHSKTIAKWQKDDFKDFTLEYKTKGLVPTLVYHQAGALVQTYLELELFSNKQSIRNIWVFFNDVTYTFIENEISESDLVCVTASFKSNATLRKCLKIPRKYTNQKSESFINNTYVTLLSLLSVSVIVHIISWLLLARHYRRISESTCSQIPAKRQKQFNAERNVHNCINISEKYIWQPEFSSSHINSLILYCKKN